MTHRILSRSDVRAALVGIVVGAPSGLWAAATDAPWWVALPLAVVVAWMAVIVTNGVQRSYREGGLAADLWAVAGRAGVEAVASGWATVAAVIVAAIGVSVLGRMFGWSLLAVVLVGVPLLAVELVAFELTRRSLLCRLIDAPRPYRGDPGMLLIDETTIALERWARRLADEERAAKQHDETGEGAP